MATKKVIRIEAQHFIHSVNDDFVVGCNHVKDALDISCWSFEKLQYVMSSLYNVGKTEVKVIEVNA